MDDAFDKGGLDSIVSKTKRLGWKGQAVSLEIDEGAAEKSKFMLLGKVLSLKPFSRNIVKEIIEKAWNTIKDVEVSVVDKNVFMFYFKHEVDVRRVWDRRPWNFKGEHLILKKFRPELSLNEVDFTEIDVWV
jgi:hypothetical protein